MHQVLKKWTYGREPKSAFEFHKDIATLIDNSEDMVANGNTLLLDLIKTHLIESKHRVVVELFPHQGFDEDHMKEEQDKISSLQSSMSNDDFENLIAESENMYLTEEEEDSSENLATIPILKLDQIGANYVPAAPTKIYEKYGILTAHTTLPTTFGLNYVDFGIAVDNIQEADISLLPILSRLFLESGTTSNSIDHFRLHMDSETGGLYTEILHETVTPNAPIDGGNFDVYTVTEGKHFVTKLVFRAKCMPNNMGHTLDLIGEAIWKTNEFSQAKTEMILKETIAEYEAKVMDEGHLFAARRLESRYSYHGLIQERLYGVEAIHELRDFLAAVSDDWEVAKSRLEDMRTKIVDGHRNGMVLSVTAEKKIMDTIDVYIKKFMDGTVPQNDQAQPFVNPHEEPHPWVPNLSGGLNGTILSSEGLTIPTTVSYVGKAGTLYKNWTPVPGSTAAVAKYIEDQYLYRKVKVEGGATDVYVKVRNQGM